MSLKATIYKLTHQVKALQTEPIGCSFFTAVHVVPKSQDDLKQKTDKWAALKERTIHTSEHKWGLLTSNIFFIFDEDLRDTEAAMIASICYRNRWHNFWIRHELY